MMKIMCLQMKGRTSEQPESINDTYVLEKDDSNVTPDSSNICNNDNQVDQNAAECVDERAALANLIVNLTLDTEENKTILKQLKKTNASLTQEIEECKTNLDETSRALGEATSQLKEKSKVISDLKVKEEKDIDKMIEMDKQLKFLNEIVYTRNQSIQTIHMLAPKCSTYNGRPTFANPRIKDVTCSYLHSLSDLNAYAELQCLYLHKVKECECLAQKLSKQTESVNKEVHNKLLKSFAKLENHSISLELALQQCKEQMKNNSVCKENGSNVFRKEREQYHEIQDLKAQMQDKNIAISELKKLIEKCKGKFVETQYLNDVNARTKKPKVVPISASKPKRKANKSVATPHKKTIVQLILFIVDSGCTKHMTGNLKLLCNFMEKFLGTVHFGNDQFAPILGYGDLNQGNVTIKRVYYVKGLNHNLFSVGQFCDADLEVAFRKSTCFVRDL
ncbi:hypothetical protein Tco_0717419 [Tanacetum coccineum]